jgi:hypothetical protein
MKGLRWALLQPVEQKLLHEGALDWIWPEAEKAGLAIGMMGGIFLKEFRGIAERYPGLKLILDHCGLNRHGQDAEAFIHLDEMTALAKLPNVAVKATGAPHYSTAALSVQEHPGRAAPHLRRLRARPLLLGHRHHPHALQLPPVRDLLHRGAAVAEGPGPREGDGPQPLQVDRLGLQVLGRHHEDHRRPGSPWSQTVIPPVSAHRQVQSFSAEELLAEMAEAGVDGALIHPPFSWDPTSNALRSRRRGISGSLRNHGPVPAWRPKQRAADRRLAPATRHDGHALGDDVRRPAAPAQGGRLRLDLARRREGTAFRSPCWAATTSTSSARSPKPIRGSD